MPPPTPRAWPARLPRRRATPTRPTAVVLVDKDDWQAGVTAAALTADPIGAPILISDGDDLSAGHRRHAQAPEAQGLRPLQGRPGDPHRLDKPARPEGYQDRGDRGQGPLRARGGDRPLLLRREGQAVAQRGGDHRRAGRATRCRPPPGPRARATRVLLTRRDALPDATRQGAARARQAQHLRARARASVVSKKVEKDARPARRGDAGSRAPTRWRTRSPSRGSRTATSAGAWWCRASTSRSPDISRPLDAAASAALATKGVFAPLLLTDRADALPSRSRTYLLSVQPGFEDDPGQAVYNRVWILGDDEQVSVDGPGAPGPDHRADPGAVQRAIGRHTRAWRARADNLSA